MPVPDTTKWRMLLRFMSVLIFAHQSAKDVPLELFQPDVRKATACNESLGVRGQNLGFKLVMRV